MISSQKLPTPFLIGVAALALVSDIKGEVVRFAQVVGQIVEWQGIPRRTIPDHPADVLAFGHT